MRLVVLSLVLSVMTLNFSAAEMVVSPQTRFNSFCETQMNDSDPVGRFISALEFVLNGQASAHDGPWARWLSQVAQVQELPDRFEPNRAEGVAQELAVRALTILYHEALSDRATLMSSLTELFRNRSEEGVKRRRVERRVRLGVQPMVFRKIVLNGKELELMTTHVTRAQWRLLLRKGNPGGDEPDDFDFPVTRSSQREVGSFVFRMNDERSRSRLVESGVLDHGSSDSIYRLLFIDEVKQLLDLVQLENENVLSGRSPDLDMERLKDFSWIMWGRESGELQPVAGRRPVLLGGHAFYDLWGLVREHAPILKKDLNPMTGYSGVGEWATWGISTDMDPRLELKAGSPFYDSLLPQVEFNKTPATLVSFRLVREPRAQWEARADEE